jgi:TP901 family phage tail tape measure protein
MADMQVQAEIRLKDNLSKPAQTALESVGKAAKKAGDATAAMPASGGAKKLAGDATDAAHALSAVERVAKKMQGALRGADQAAGKLRGTMRGAVDQMKQLGKGVGKRFDSALKGGAAVVGAGYAAKASIQKSVSYESQLLDMANVAYADRNAKGRIAGAKDLDAVVKASIREGGGTRESAASALNTMLAAGTDEVTAKKLLPTIQKAATASGASGEELASILTKGISQGLFTAEDAPAVIDKAIKAGEAGAFELKDMARWLPQIFSAGKGMKNMAGYEAHLANLQGIAQVTGSKDQAGNAYFNLLGKITSTETAKNFKKMKIDLAGEIAKGVAKGEDPVTVFARLTEKVIGKDRKYQELQKRIASAKDPEEKRQLLEQAADYLQGTAIGKVIQDREALLGLSGILSQRQMIATVREGIQNAEGATDTSFQVKSSSGEFQQQRLANEKDIAQSAMYDTIKDPLNRAITSVADYAAAHPGQATVAAGAGTVGAIAAGGAGASSLVGMLRGGPAAAAGAGAAGAGAEGAAAGAAKAGSAIGWLGKVTRFAPWLVAGGTAISTEMDDSLTRAQKNEEHTGTALGLGGALAGAKLGAMGGALVGSVVPVLGTAIGGAVGGILGGIAGWFGGEKAGGWLGNKIFGEDGEPPAQPAMPPAPVEQTLNVKLEVDGQVLAETTQKYQTQQGLRQ